MPHLVHPSSSVPCCSVVELRQYTLRPGHRDVLVGLFERELIEPQEAVGMHVVGTFEDVGDPDRFVWLRGFASDADRTRALSDFYLGPVWAAHRDAANATMLDSDDVLLLRPVPGLPVVPDTPTRPATRGQSTTTRYSAVVYALRPESDESEFIEGMRTSVLPAVRRSGAAVVCVLRTNPATNGFPHLPVREGERVVVLLVSVDSAEVRSGLEEALVLAGTPGAEVQQRLRLVPTDRSALR